MPTTSDTSNAYIAPRAARGRPARALATLVALLALSACGGDDPEEERKANQAGAESTVREYLTALVDKDGSAACSKFTPDYQRAVVRQNRDFARDNKVNDCPALIDKITRVSPSVSFEGKPLDRDAIGGLELKTSVRANGEAFNATVTGAAGVQRYELETRDGRWLIANIERVG